MRPFRIAAFSTRSGAQAVQKATGVLPVTFPPESAETFKPQWLEGFDLLYFHLHGIAGQPFWYGDGYVTAMTHHQVAAARLNNAVFAEGGGTPGAAVCFVANCFGQDSRMVEALFRAGASAVVAGPGKNYTGRRGRVAGANRLGREFVRAVAAGAEPVTALDIAKHRIRWWALISRADRDALEFSIQERTA